MSCSSLLKAVCLFSDEIFAFDFLFQALIVIEAVSWFSNEVRRGHSR